MLFMNSLTSIPVGLCQLVGLRVLWIGCNNLVELPREFGQLASLDWGQSRHTSSAAVDGNPLSRPPVDVCKQGINAIAMYFSQGEAQEKRSNAKR